MAFDKDQFRALIAEVLTEAGMHSESAVELLMMTAAQESHLGTYLWQVGGGPARGAFQVEKATEEDIWKNYLAYREGLADKVNCYAYHSSHEEEMVGNLPYQIIMARIHYRRVPEKLPPADDVVAMAEYYKKYYNTHKGKATVEEAIKNYKRFCV